MHAPSARAVEMRAQGDEIEGGKLRTDIMRQRMDPVRKVLMTNIAQPHAAVISKVIIRRCVW